MLTVGKVENYVSRETTLDIGGIDGCMRFDGTQLRSYPRLVSRETSPVPFLPLIDEPTGGGEQAATLAEGSE